MTADGSPTHTPARRPARAWSCVLAALVFVCGVLRYAPIVDDPWDNTHASIVAVCYTANIVRSFRDAGFATLRGEPHLWVEPIPDPIGVEYGHHPPLSFWLAYGMVQALGWSEAAFRALPIAFTATSAMLLFVLIARYYGSLFGLAASAIALTVPMSVLFGWMPGYEPGVLCSFMLGFVAHDALRRKSPGSWWPTLIPCFLAPLFDWQGCFIVPGLLIYEIAHPRGERRAWRVVLLAGPAAVLSVATVIALNVYWEGWDPGAAFDRFVGVANSAMSSRWTMMDWVARQVHYWLTLMTWPVSLLAALGLVVSVVEARRDSVARLALAFMTMAVLNVVVFPGRSIDHDFWWFTGIPAAASAAVVMLRMLAGASRRRRALCAAACLAITIHAALESVERYAQHRTTFNRDVGNEFNSIAGPNDLILFSTRVNCVEFYLRSRTYAPVTNPADLRFAKAMRGHPDLEVDRVVFVTSKSWPHVPGIDAALPEIGRVEQLTHDMLFARMPILAYIVQDLTIAYVGE